jgi:DNA-binding transcriptional MerR regulator
VAEVKVSERLLPIGELARRAGVAPSALRYWEDLGLLPAPARSSGQRRYPASAVALVGVLLLLRDVGFSLAEQRAFVAARGAAPDAWRRLARRKLAELDARIADARAAREALAHALRCPHEDVRQCPTFRALVAARLAGQPLREAHAQAHAPALLQEMQQMAAPGSKATVPGVPRGGGARPDQG